MAEPDGGALATPETATEDSRRLPGRPRRSGRGFAVRIRASGPRGWVLLALGLAGAILLVAAKFATLSYRTIGIGACSDRVSPGVCSTSGSGALLILALAVVLFALGAALGRSLPSAIALIACGIAVVVIALAIDRPKLDDTRGLEADYTQVRAHTGAGYGLEIAGGVLAVVAGGFGLVRGPRTADRGPRGTAATASERAEERRRRRESGNA